MARYVALIDTNGVDQMFTVPHYSDMQAVATADKLRDSESDVMRSYINVAERWNTMDLRARFNPHRHPVKITFEMDVEDYDEMVNAHKNDENPMDLVLTIMRKAETVSVVEGSGKDLEKTLEFMRVEQRY